jgi:AcrR family transcriptional regulator
MPLESVPSLRERKKAETWQAIHEAAAGLALDEDTRHVTVEAIASEAGISQRTFFNYFATKEDAILGVQSPRMPELPAAFLDAEGLLPRITELLLAVGRSAYAPDVAGRRARLLEKYPPLMLRRRELTLQGEDLVHQELTAAMAHHPDWSQGLSGHGVEDVARILTLAAGVPLRYTLLARGTVAGSDLDRHALDDALDLYQDLYRKLS